MERKQFVFCDVLVRCLTLPARKPFTFLSGFLHLYSQKYWEWATLKKTAHFFLFRVGWAHSLWISTAKCCPSVLEQRLPAEWNSTGKRTGNFASLLSCTATTNGLLYPNLWETGGLRVNAGIDGTTTSRLLLITNRGVLTKIVSFSPNSIKWAPFGARLRSFSIIALIMKFAIGVLN